MSPPSLPPLVAPARATGSSGGALLDLPQVPPLVVDLNGDGAPEVVAAVPGAQLVLLHPPAAAAQAAGTDGGDAGAAQHSLPRAAELRRVSLLPPGVRVAAGRSAVAMAAGTLGAPANRTGHVTDPGVAASAGRPRVAVLTASWMLLLLDHNLDVLWETSLADIFGHGRAREVALLVVPHAIAEGDHGAVLVAGAAEVHDFAEGGGALDESLERELFAEREASKRAFGDTEGTEPLNEGERRHRTLERSAGGAAPRGVRYVALDGRTGARRWTRESVGPARAEPGGPPQLSEALRDALHDQHAYRLDERSLAAHEPYHAASCRAFRESVLRATPHAWARRADTTLELAHFGRARRGRTSGAHRAHAGRERGASVGAAAVGVAGDALGVTKRDSHRHAVSAGAVSAAAARHHADNALVAHLEEGIEALNLYTGEPLCSLMLPARGLHADLDGDGVLDHVQATGALHGALGANAEAKRAVPEHHTSRSCWAYAATGALREHALFDGSICKLGGGLDRVGSRQFGRGGDALAPLEVATPAALPHGHARVGAGARAKDGGGGHGLRARADVGFLNSRGEVTAYAVDGSKRWQVRLDVGWRNEALPAGVAATQPRVAPTLELMPLRWPRAGLPGAGLGGGVHLPGGGGAAARRRQGGGVGAFEGPAVLLAAGEAKAALLSPASGRREQTVLLPAAPALPLILCDLDGDGYTDALLVGQHALYGLIQQRHPGALLFSTLLGGLLLAMALIYLTQDAGLEGDEAPRATDY